MVFYLRRKISTAFSFVLTIFKAKQLHYLPALPEIRLSNHNTIFILVKYNSSYSNSSYLEHKLCSCRRQELNDDISGVCHLLGCEPACRDVNSISLMETVLLLSPWQLQPLIVRQALRSWRKQMDKTDCESRWESKRETEAGDRRKRMREIWRNDFT